MKKNTKNPYQTAKFETRVLKKPKGEPRATKTQGERDLRCGK